jgi:hypothetical protein
MKTWQVFLIIILVPLAIFLAWGLSVGMIGINKDLNRRQADANRDVYQHNASYVLGKQQILAKYLAEYRLAQSQADKDALSSVINTELSTVDRANLSPDTIKNLEKEGF